MTAEQSLALITRMIDQAKGNVTRNAFYFLLWGWIVLIANLGMFVLIKLSYPYPFAIWLITIPAWAYTMYASFKRQKETSALTHLDSISGWLWITFGVCIITLIAFGYRINFQINPVILLFCSIPTFMSGVILRFTPLKFGGVMFWIFAIVSFIVGHEYQFLSGAAAIAFGYLVPGYLLKRKESQ
ncbi:hypothetical protein [Pseudochryseolinea flava]|nr:hypothetical protein [Pseudochryseolinea flava]